MKRLLAIILALLCWAIPAALEAQSSSQQQTQRRSPFAEDEPVCPYNTETRSSECPKGTVTPGPMVSTEPRPGQTVVIPTAPIEPAEDYSPPSKVITPDTSVPSVWGDTRPTVQGFPPPESAGPVSSSTPSAYGENAGPPATVDGAVPAAQSGAGVFAAPPPPGISGIGAMPGPQTMGQAVAGVVLPGLAIILINTLAGLPGGGFGGSGSGGANPVPGEPPPPNAAEIEEARAKAEAYADWLKQREEDLRQVREQKSFIAATAAGAGQAGFSTAAHSQQLADLTQRENELTAAIAKGGGDTSYVATVRDTVKVGTGFIEAIRIAQEHDKAQALAAARAKMEQLEKDRAQTQADYWKDVRDGFWGNIVKDVDAIPGQLQDAAKAGLKTIGTVVGETAKALTDPANWRDAASAAVATVRDVITHPIDSASKVGSFYGGVARAAGKAVHHAATHPVETVKAVLGADNWEKAFDPNVPVTERIVRTLVGVFDAAATVAGVKAAATAGKKAVTGLVETLGKTEAASGGAKAIWAENRFSNKLMSQSRANARLEQIGGALEDRRYTVTEDPLVGVRGKDGKLAGSRDGLLGGMTEDARRHAQLVTDRYGVKLDVRPTNAASHDLIKRGEGVPKAPHCKSKTINELDPLLGANHADIGKAGYFEPKLPSEKQLEALDPDTRSKLLRRYKERVEEYKDQAEHIAELTKQGKVTVKKGVVFDGPSGKPYTGDHDLFDIRDATTGRPLPRYQIGPDGKVLMNADGTPKLNPVREQIIKELQQPPFNAQHGAHMDWKYDHLPNSAPSHAPTGTKSDFEIAKGIDQGVTGKHNEGGQPLITFGAGTSEPTGSWFSGGR